MHKRNKARINLIKYDSQYSQFYIGYTGLILTRYLYIWYNVVMFDRNSYAGYRYEPIMYRNTIIRLFKKIKRKRWKY